MGNSLPSINSLEHAIPTLKIWQQRLNTLTRAPVPLRTPFNFRAAGGTTGATGITLSWEVVKGSDGYEVQSSPTGDFSNAPIIATLTSQVATSFFDSTGATAVKRYYRIRTTTGTNSAPRTVKSQWTAPINATSGSGVTTYDSTSATSGVGGWNRGGNPGIGSRKVL